MKRIMSFIKKYPKKRVIAVCLSALLILLIAVLPTATAKRGSGDEITASVLSGTAEKGDISSLLIGAGTLSQQEGENINIPSTVKIKEFLVSNGDRVKKGDDLLTVDHVTLMQAINELQETMDYLREEMESVKDESGTDKITAQKSGTVKAVYVKKGDDVQNIMLEYGALAVISLDGLMSVEIETDKDISAGENVKITFKDKTETDGQVKTYLNGVALITFEDENYAEGSKVTVTKEDGTEIGSGKIEVNNRWTATAYSGTVTTVNISEEEEVSAGETLFSLENVSSTAEYDSLASQHREYEKLMLSLFEIYQSGTVKATADGIVSGIDKDSCLLLSNTEDASIELLANAPDGNDEAAYVNYIGKIISVNEGIWNVNLNPENQSVTDYKNLIEVDFDEEKMTQNDDFNPTVPVYEVDGSEWKQIDTDDVKVGDVLLFAGTGISDIVWAVRVSRAGDSYEETSTDSVTTEPETTEPETTEPEATEPSTSVSDSTNPSLPATSNPAVTLPSTAPSDNMTVTDGADGGLPRDDNITMPSGGDSAVPNGGDISMPSGDNMTVTGGGDFTLPSNQQTEQNQNVDVSGFSGSSFSEGSFGNASASQSAAVQPENEFELFDLEGTTVVTVIPNETMTVSVAVDELDLSKVKLGMSAEITLDAFMGESFEGTVTDIGTSGENSGGNSKFAVEITIDRAENMLSGMNATANIILSSKSDVVTVPVEALCDLGNETVIYTGYNKSDETLKNPVTVTVGVSDGKVAEIVTGLSEGQEYYYSYYDEYQSTEASSGFSFSSFGIGGFGGTGGGNRGPGR